MLIFLFIIVAFFSLYFSGPSKNKKLERLVIYQGMSEPEIVNKIFSEGYVRNKDVLVFILSLKGWHEKIQPGGYMISDSMNVYEVARTLVLNPYQKWVVIPPGKRKEQTALIIKRAINWSEAEIKQFIKGAQEGYLYPDTYLMDINSDPQNVINKFTNNFNEKFYLQLQKDLLAQNIRNDTAVKIASIIEREAGGESDKRIISAIIWNRVNRGMRLEIDATIQYPVASEACKLDTDNPELDNCDFWPLMTSKIIQKTDSPYNTYKIDGLPPAPISSPTLSTIEAVAYPIETDALYYLHSSDKQIHTAKTYEDHLKNIASYLN